MMHRRSPSDPDRRTSDATAAEIAAELGMQDHPEGGRYVETWREPTGPGERPASSAILFLLDTGERSRWHRVDATEIWHWHAGGPLELRLAQPDGSITAIRLGPDVLAGQRPQAVVPAGTWQEATPLEGWVLVGCTVAPAFSFEGFELAPEGQGSG